MDIYSFIDSRDIAEYCRKTSHKFETIEMVTIICRSMKSSAEEKKIAFAWIIENTIDERVQMNCDFEDYKSLHELLAGIIDDGINEYSDVYIDLELNSLSIPIPFEIGDLVTPKDSDKVYVLSNWDWSDDIAECYYITEDFKLCDLSLTPLNVEYYNGELTGNNRFLKFVSLQLKNELGRCDLCNLLDIYDVMKNNGSLEDINNLWPCDYDFFIVSNPDKKK